MAWNYYFKDRSGAQNGPVSLEELVTLTRSGRVAPDCLVWAEGGESMPAAKHPALAAIFVEIAAQSPAGVGPMQASFPVWGLFWRSIALMLAIVFVIPAPWVGLWFYRWLAERVALPGGRALFLDSALANCWYIFAGMGLVEYIGPATAGTRAEGVGSLASIALSVLLTVMLIQWFCRSLRSADGKLSIVFDGGFLGYLSWTLLVALSALTVIGWAWVLKYMLRWMCAKVQGSHAFEFVGGGLDLLWRTLVLALALGLLIPFPWALRWYAEWYVSQITVRPSAA